MDKTNRHTKPKDVFTTLMLLKTVKSQRSFYKTSVSTLVSPSTPQCGLWSFKFQRQQ